MFFSHSKPLQFQQQSSCFTAPGSAEQALTPAQKTCLPHIKNGKPASDTLKSSKSEQKTEPAETNHTALPPL